jgi:hypothetical protein
LVQTAVTILVKIQPPFPLGRVLFQEEVTSIQIFQLQCSQASDGSGHALNGVYARAVDLETRTVEVALA